MPGQYPELDGTGYRPFDSRPGDFFWSTDNGVGVVKPKALDGSLVSPFWLYPKESQTKLDNWLRTSRNSDTYDLWKRAYRVDYASERTDVDGNDVSSDAGTGSLPIVTSHESMKELTDKAKVENKPWGWTHITISCHRSIAVDPDIDTEKDFSSFGSSGGVQPHGWTKRGSLISYYVNGTLVQRNHGSISGGSNDSIKAHTAPTINDFPTNPHSIVLHTGQGNNDFAYFKIRGGKNHHPSLGNRISIPQLESTQPQAEAPDVRAEKDCDTIVLIKDFNAVNASMGKLSKEFGVFNAGAKCPFHIGQISGEIRPLDGETLAGLAHLQARCCSEKEGWYSRVDF
jgi:hypothetical protein